jgi:hypothetical protein
MFIYRRRRDQRPGSPRKGAKGLSMIRQGLIAGDLRPGAGSMFVEDEV